MRHRDIAACAVAATVMGALATVRAGGLYVNVTPSMPIGLWHVTSVDVALARGEIVAVCLPDGDALHLALERSYIAAGKWPSGAEPVLKPIAAIGGAWSTSPRAESA